MPLSDLVIFYECKVKEDHFCEVRDKCCIWQPISAHRAKKEGGRKSRRECDTFKRKPPKNHERAALFRHFTFTAQLMLWESLKLSLPLLVKIQIRCIGICTFDITRGVARTSTWLHAGQIIEYSGRRIRFLPPHAQGPHAGLLFSSSKHL